MSAPAPHPTTPDAPAGAGTGTGTSAVLAGLRVALHVAFAALLAVGLGRVLVGLRGETGAAGADGSAAEAALVIGLAAALAGVYLAGTVVERRRWRRGMGLGRGAAAGWLAVVLALWGLLVARHEDFAWVAFPLFFVVLHVSALVLADRPAARRIVGPLLVAGMAGVVVLGMAGPDGVRPPAVVGPLVGAAVAVVLSAAYRALHEESERQRAVAEELRAARADLAESQRRAGALGERERLARDIHDTLTQGLASIVLVSRAAQDALRDGDPALAGARLETVRATAAESLAESRAFVRELRSGATGAGLVEALELTVRAFADQQAAAGTPVAADVDVSGDPVPLPHALEAGLVRAVRASLANVGQHARASRVRVSVGFLPGELTVDVADDGVGFDPAAVAARSGRGEGASTGVGLAGLRERIALLGGEVAVETAPGEGTVVALRVPLTGGAGSTAGRIEEDA